MHLLCSVQPLPRSTQTNAGVVNELGALGPQFCMLHTPGAASDVKKLTWKNHLHSTLASRAAPGSETVLSLDTSLQSRTGFLSCRSKEEINLPLPCKEPEAAVQLLKREKLL